MSGHPKRKSRPSAKGTAKYLNDTQSKDKKAGGVKVILDDEQAREMARRHGVETFLIEKSGGDYSGGTHLLIAGKKVSRLFSYFTKEGDSGWACLEGDPGVILQFFKDTIATGKAFKL